MSAKSPLMKLPAELREHIYRYTIVSDSPIVTDPHDTATIKQPNLLLTCRQIRSETLPIYYRENTFDIPINNMDGAGMIPFLCLLAKHNTAEEITHRAAILLGPGIHWENLKEWLKATYERRIAVTLRAPLADLPSGCPLHLVLRAHSMIVLMAEQPWEVVEEALKLLRGVASGYDSAWK